MRKKNKISLRVICLAAIVTLASACTKDLLEPTPSTSIIDNEAYATPARILSLVNGLYAGVKHGEFYGGRFIIYNEIRGEEFIVNKPNGVTGLDTWNQNVNSNSSEVQNVWSRAYAAINRVNVFLAGLNANSSKIDAATRNIYTGEAELLRALTYFALIQTYARPFIADNGASLGVPLRLVAETDLTGAGTNDLARSTVAEVYAQILKDLDDAETKLPATAVNGAFRAYRLTAIALKARVYLTQANYTQVIAESAKLISAAAPYQSPNGAAQLETNIANVFGGAYTGSAGFSESLLSFPFTSTDIPGTQNQLAFYFYDGPAGRPVGNLEYYLNPTGIVSNPVFSATSTDARKALIGRNTTVAFLAKYRTPSPFTDYVPVIRYAEVLLNAAEAYARTGDLVRATALLYAVRRRSDAAFIFPAGDIGTQQALVNTILTERRIELLGEGFRYPDLRRTGQSLPTKTSPQSGIAPTVAPTAPNYIWPISGVELQNNKLMVPNP